jgi:hypothetical protein
VRTQPAITGDASTTLADYIHRPAILATAAETVDLRALVDAFGRLAQVPTARLERVFAEHVDLATYRLDAWKTGLATSRLGELRHGERQQRELYLGDYGWLEDVRSRAAPVPVELGGALAAVFARPNDPPLVHDPQNAGYIHAPSLDHAATAAILKNAYAVNATPTQPDAFAVNLSSNRVRHALEILEDFLADVQTALALVPLHDPTPVDIAGQLAAVTSLRETLVARVTQLAADLTTRIAAAQQGLAEATALVDANARFDAVRAAAKHVLGEDVVVLPRFRLATERANELANAFAASPALLTDLVAAGRRFPVDDWLYGVARVREKLAAWEQTAILGEAFTGTAAALVPVQLPHLPNDRWAALEIDLTATGAHDRLLYTADVPAGFTPHAVQCGLVLDEWPEVIPAPDVLTGLTFHFDRPSAQPPQVMLLALPAALRGRWTWDDLVGAITETLDDTKSRAVEPSHVDSSAYGQFLPATLMAVTLYWITVATNLALNNTVYDHIGAS